MGVRLNANSVKTIGLIYIQTKDNKEQKLALMQEDITGLSHLESESLGLLGAGADSGVRNLEVDTETDKDAIAHAKQNIEISKGIKEGTLNPYVYRGEHGYASYFAQTEDDIRAKKFSGTLGPVRAPTFIRNTTRVDYNPELCKDYYETGWCSFGDSCIFIHDRGDYKPGWMLDQEYDKEMKKKMRKAMGEQVSDDSSNYEIHSQSDNEGELDSDGLPLKCRICEQFFTAPVMTPCAHCFCEKCALQHYTTESGCFICGKPTNGIFNDAPKVDAKSRKMKKLMEQKEKEGED